MGTPVRSAPMGGRSILHAARISPLGLLLLIPLLGVSGAAAESTVAQSFDPDKVRTALVATDLNTFYGDIRFGSEGNNIAKPMILRQIQNGKYVPVAPSQFVDGEMIFPRPGS